MQDKPVTDKELDQFYGKDESRVKADMREVLTETIRTAPSGQLGLQYISHTGGPPRLAMYSLYEVVTDYGTDTGPMVALLAVLAGSDCPLVAAYREALAARYIDSWGDIVEEFLA